MTRVNTVYDNSLILNSCIMQTDAFSESHTIYIPNYSTSVCYVLVRREDPVARARKICLISCFLEQKGET